MASLGGYTIEEELGRGSMGVVYAASRGGRRVVIKVMTAAGALDPDALARFVVEARALARLDHPNIVRFVEAGASGGTPFVALEHIEGETLARRLSRGPLPPLEAARVAARLAGAVHHAHQRSILHRDLKPANVILRPDGSPTVVDFGLAKVLEAGYGPRLSRTGDVIGTPLFMAPEQALGIVSDIGPWTDVYGLGAVLYACLTGGPPVVAADVAAALHAVANVAPAPPSRATPGLDPALEELCLRALAKAPGDRFPSAASLEASLEEWLAAARRPPLPRPPARGATRGALGGAAVGLVVLAVAWALRAPDLREGELPAPPVASPAPVVPGAPPVTSPAPAEPAPEQLAKELLAVAIGLQRQGHIDEAARSVARVVELTPGDAEAWAFLGKLRGDLGDTAAGLAACDQAVALDPASVAAHINRGGLRFAAGDLEGALEDCSQALAAPSITAGDWVNATYNRATIRLSLGELPQALADLDVLCQRHDGADERALRAQTHEAMGELEAAAVDYDRCVALDPSRGDVALRLARLRFDGLLDHEGARRALDVARRARPNDPAVWILGARLGGPRAVAEAERATTLAPQDPDALAAQAAALLDAGDVRGASRAATAAAQGAAPPAAALITRAAVRRAEGDERGARDDLARALRGPLSPRARADAAELLQQLDGPDAALRALGPALAEKRPPAPLLVLAAELNIVAGRTTDAAAAYERAAVRAPDHPCATTWRETAAALRAR